MTYVPDESLLAGLTAALVAVDQATRALIVAELESMLPEYQQQQAAAAGRLRRAYAAAAPGEQALADLGGKIADAQAELASWQQQADSGDIGAKVAAKPWITEWQSEVHALQQKREQAEQDLQLLRDERDDAQAAQEHATMELEALEANADPLLAYFVHGKDTGCYKAFRWGLALDAALKDQNHPEHWEAKEHIEHLASLTGREHDWAQMWADVYEAANPPAPEKTGAEVVAGLHAEQERNFQVRSRQAALDRDVQEDHTVPVPIPPRNDTVHAHGRDELRWDR